MHCGHVEVNYISVAFYIKYEYATTSTLYVMALSPTYPTWCYCSNHQVVKTTTLLLQWIDIYLYEHLH